MKKIDDWENVKASEMEERFVLGGKKCKIVNVKPFNYNGIDKVSLELDVVEGDNVGYFQKKYDEKGDNAKYWDDGATISFPAEPETDQEKSYFKGLITAIESYNPNFKWNWDETKLKGLLINVYFSLKEYEGNDGNTYTKPQVSRFVNSKDNFKEDYIPSVRKLNNEFVKYEDYIKNKPKATQTATPQAEDDAIEIALDSEDMPF